MRNMIKNLLALFGAAVLADLAFNIATDHIAEEVSDRTVDKLLDEMDDPCDGCDIACGEGPCCEYCDACECCDELKEEGLNEPEEVEEAPGESKGKKKI